MAILAALYLLAEKLLHGFSELRRAYLAITVGVELWGVERKELVRTETYKHLESPKRSHSALVISWFRFLPLFFPHFVVYEKSRKCCSFKQTSFTFSSVIMLSLTSLKASLSSFTPIMSAVSASSLGPISSTKSSKSTWPPTEKCHRQGFLSRRPWRSNLIASPNTHGSC